MVIYFTQFRRNVIQNGRIALMRSSSYLLCKISQVFTVSVQLYDGCFVLANPSNNLDMSYKTDLDFSDHLRREKPTRYLAD